MINKFGSRPYPTRAEEQELATRIRAGDVAAAGELAEGHLRTAALLSRGDPDRFQDIACLFVEKARSFDPGRGTRFLSYVRRDALGGRGRDETSVPLGPESAWDDPTARIDLRCDVREALSKLTEQERDIITSSYGYMKPQESLRSIGERHQRCLAIMVKKRDKAKEKLMEILGPAYAR